MMELGKGRQSKTLHGEERHESQRLGVKRSLSSSSSSSWSESGAVAAARSKFMSVVTDDILQEILVRLPDSRSVIQCSFVCKGWFSLVSPSSQVGFDFIRKFNHHHRLKRYQKEDQGEQLPYSLLMKGCYHTSGFGPSYRSGSPSYHFLSDKSKILHYGNVSTFITAYGDAKREDDYLEFLLWPSNQGCIISSFDDLLLMRMSELEFCICNPLTKQWILLPNIPISYNQSDNFYYRCGFVCKANCTCNSQFRQFGRVGGGGGRRSSPSSSSSSSSYYCNCSIKYRVALITTSRSIIEVLSVAVFSSETGQWRKSKLLFPNRLYLWHETSVGNNGIIYWGFGEEVLKGIVAFNPFKDDSREEEEEEQQQQQRCHLISLPLEFTGCQVHGQAMKARLGVVRGRLRLAHFYFDVRSNTYVLKAWELLYDDDDNHNNNASWDLVHDVLIKRSDESVKLALVALHPEDGDTFFLTRIISREIRHEGYDLFQYKIGSSDDVELVCRCRNGFCAFPLVHPWWPTTIPSLSSST